MFKIETLQKLKALKTCDYLYRDVVRLYEYDICPNCQNGKYKNEINEDRGICLCCFNKQPIKMADKNRVYFNYTQYTQYKRCLMALRKRSRINIIGFFCIDYDHELVLCKTSHTKEEDEEYFNKRCINVDKRVVGENWEVRPF